MQILTYTHPPFCRNIETEHAMESNPILNGKGKWDLHRDQFSLFCLQTGFSINYDHMSKHADQEEEEAIVFRNETSFRGIFSMFGFNYSLNRIDSRFISILLRSTGRGSISIVVERKLFLKVEWKFILFLPFLC